MLTVKILKVTGGNQKIYAQRKLTRLPVTLSKRLRISSNMASPGRPLAITMVIVLGCGCGAITMDALGM